MADIVGRQKRIYTSAVNVGRRVGVAGFIDEYVT